MTCYTCGRPTATRVRISPRAMVPMCDGCGDRFVPLPPPAPPPYVPSFESSTPYTPEPDWDDDSTPVVLP